MIELNKIEFSYGNGFKLHPVSVTVDKKEFLTILGPNGSGKSTLLKLISGYLKPSSGSVKIDGRNINEFDSLEIAKIFSYVPQFTYSIFPYSVYEIVMMGRTPYFNFAGYESNEDREIVEEALQRLELDLLAEKGINEISGGEAQRAFIAKALVQRAKVMLLDEPNAHLDIKHQIQIFELLAQLNEEEELTIITVSHDLNLPGHFSKKILLLKEGEMLKYGDKKEILTEKNINEVFEVNVNLSQGRIPDSIQVNILP